MLGALMVSMWGSWVVTKVAMLGLLAEMMVETTAAATAVMMVEKLGLSAEKLADQ